MPFSFKDFKTKINQTLHGRYQLHALKITADDKYNSAISQFAQVSCQYIGARAGVICRGAQGGGAPLLKFFITLGGLAPFKNSCFGLAFQSLLTLLPKYFLLL